MTRVIKIGGNPVEMTGNAASSFIYGKIFGEDFEQTEISTNEITKMMFVMAKQAEVGELELYRGKLTELDFLKWISRFDYMDIMNVAPEALDLLVAQKKTKSSPKAKAD